MRKCPFCGGMPTFEYPYLMHQEKENRWTLFHYCDNNITVIVTADTVEKVIQKWNGENDV